MRIFIKTIAYLIVIILLTALTQIGGLVFLLSWLLYRLVLQGKIGRIKRGFLVKTATFLTLYAACTFVVVPILAKPFGRVPLPFFTTHHIRPVTHWTCILNRNYVRPALKSSLETVAKSMYDRFPGAEIQYLDASLPFFDGFPLVPHLSHNDGRKLDLAFFYLDRRTGQNTNDKPAFSGYGVSEAPLPNENNRIQECLEKGYWQYDCSKYLTFGANPEAFDLDSERTRAMIELFSAQPAIEKMFLEPHLVSRMDLDNNRKIRFHGCQAVRHDDHLHIQVK
ncbi:MAG: hypothetical protein IT262_19395 [Saprospiraceae bacterium]|nr:hypothetical protein [Saprospiraceae bacterium]